ncbi:hypothetical protein TNCV_2912361 [Trichonephila clavipes]|nr:hypothetical protein TNCV_2912361 [Trichonephila clavipes]
MPLIEDLSRYGIEDCSYSPEAQKSNAYSTIDNLQDRLSYADNLTPLISTRALLRYCRILSFDIAPTTDGNEKNNSCTLPTSQNSREIRGVRRDRSTPRDRRGESTRNTGKDMCFVFRHHQ